MGRRFPLPMAVPNHTPDDRSHSLKIGLNRMKTIPNFDKLFSRYFLLEFPMKTKMEKLHLPPSGVSLSSNP
jgi:hypothetical protein